MVKLWKRIGNTAAPPCNNGDHTVPDGTDVSGFPKFKTYEHSHQLKDVDGTEIKFPVYIAAGSGYVSYSQAECEEAWVVFYADKYGNGYVPVGGSGSGADFAFNCHSHSTGRTDHVVRELGPILSALYKDPSPYPHRNAKIIPLEKDGELFWGHSLKFSAILNELPSGNYTLETKE